MTLSCETVLAQIAQGPTSYADITGTGRRDRRLRSGCKELVDQLKAEGLVKVVNIHGRPMFVLPDWSHPPEYVQEQIDARSRRTIDGCLEWTAYIDPLRGPMFRLGDSGSSASVRRWLWERARGPLQYQESIRCMCSNEACIELSHFRKERREELGRGRPNTLVQRAKIAATLRAKSKITQEIVDRARAGESITALAAEACVTPQALRYARAGDTWKDYTNRFALGLGAR